MRLKSGEDLALVADAGTPVISDPGYRLVRAAIEAGVLVTAVPGPCAAIAALALSGLPTDRFTFEGFLPSRSGDRERMLARLGAEPRTMVIYEAARRLPQLLSDMVSAFGPTRQAAVVREATKTHEEILRGTLAQLAENFATREVLGEVTLIVEGRRDHGRVSTLSPLEHSRVVDILREAGLGLKAATAIAARITKASRHELYQDALRREEMKR
jgi:16S rRNA (cytidine1402-2'-O)-methyltransferase